MVAAVLSLGSGATSAGTFLRIPLGLTLIGLLTRGLTRSLWRRVTPPDSIVVVGSGPLASAVERKLELFRDMHANVVLRLDDDEIQGSLRSWRAERVRVNHVPNAPEGLPVERIVIASQRVDERLIAELVAVCRRDAVKLSVVPPARSIFGTAVLLNHVADLPLIEYNTWDLSRSTCAIKRCIDVVGSLLLLMLLAPVLALAAILIRLGSPGPALFVQIRAGQHGRPFRMYKLRTMVNGAEHHLAELVDIDCLEAPVFKLQRDPRVTRIGRYLRRWSLDEVPQLINVLRAEMSLVGPRPEQIDLVERYGEEAARVRLAVKPGLTGPMQVFGRAELSFGERLAVEREYVENLSIQSDIRILLATVAVVARGTGAL
jgi:exopolysaccharide biosynthesis polyprenyl glycosylphosphotransferase